MSVDNLLITRQFSDTIPTGKPIGVAFMHIDDQAGTSPEVTDSSENPRDLTSVAPQGETEESLLSVVRSAVETSEPSDDDEVAESPPAQGQEIEEFEPHKPEGESRDDLEMTEEQLDLYPPRVKKRFKRLLAERHELREKLTTYEPDAKQYRDIQMFMESNGLTAEEVANTLGMIAQMKSGDPAAAYELMRQRMEELALAAGKKLPQELEERVEQGFVDRETAQQLYQKQVQAERQAALAQNQLQQRTYQDAQTQVVSIANAVQAWEQSTKVTDPDFEIKVDLVKDRVRAHVATNGMPKTPDEAVKLTKEAYESVTQVLRRAQGPKQSMRPAVGGKVNGSAAPEPRSLLDVIRQASVGA
jgi:hypothetical protein